MSKGLTDKKRPFVTDIRKFIGEFPDLKYDGAKIICSVCDTDLMCRDRTDCRKHINSRKHTNKKAGVGQSQRTLFMFDLLVMLISCNIPFHVLNNETFRSFWNKYNSNWKLPSRATLQNEVPSARVKIENTIKSQLQNKKLWLCVDETTDCKKNSVLNVLVRTLEPRKPSQSFLLASKRLPKCTAAEITRVVLNTLEKFQLSKDQLLMFVTDGAATMLSVGRLLKKECGNFLHVTCKIHALHLVAEEIRRCYPNVNGLIASTKAVFLKSPKRTGEFHRQCPGIPEPPQPIVTRWGTWLQAAFYYSQHFQKIKSVVLHFDPKEATAIKECQAKFQDAQVETDLQTIQHNYTGLVEAIEKLQNPALSLTESLQIVDAVHAQLHAVSDAKNNSVLAKLDSVLKKDSNFRALRQICSDCASTDPLRNYKDYFNYANITSVDVERSFSSYKNIFSSRRTSFAETTMETYQMLQMANRSHLVYDNAV